MRFLWKSQLRKERGKLLPANRTLKRKASRKETLQARTERPSASYAGVVFLWFLFFGTLLYVLFFSPYLLITERHVVSTGDFAEQASLENFVEEVTAGKYLGVLPKSNFFLVRLTRVADKVHVAYPLVREVSVSVQFPHTLAVRIVPREKLVLWCSAQTCSHLLESGFLEEKSAVFARADIQARTLTITDTSEKPVPLGEKVFPDTLVPLVLMLKERLESVADIEIEDSFTVSSRFANELRIKTRAGWEIYINTERPLEESLAALTLLLDKEIAPEKRPLLRYIDLRTESRIYYAFQGESMTESEALVTGTGTLKTTLTTPEGVAAPAVDEPQATQSKKKAKQKKAP